MYKKDYYNIGTSPQAYTGWKNKKTRNIMVAKLRRHDCCDTYSIWLLLSLPAIKLIFLAIFVCETLAEELQESSNQLKQLHIRMYLVSQRLVSEHFVQAKNVFLSYGSTRVMCRNTLLDDSDDWRFISQTCFHCQYYCISFCVQLWCIRQSRRNH